MNNLQCIGATIVAGGNKLIDGATLSLQPREMVALLGPNGAGKTTLIRAALGLEKLVAGKAMLCGDDVMDLSPVERARRITYLPQIRPLAWPNVVRDVIALGRFSHGATPGRLNPAHAAAVDQAIRSCDLVHLAGRRTDTLSGGEQGRVHCARAFAAQAPLLIADEPTAALDPRHQFRIMDLLQSYVAAGGGALVVLHDLQLAARYATRLVWMKDGRIVADGPPSETLAPERVREVYGVKASIEGLRICLDGAI